MQFVETILKELRRRRRSRYWLAETMQSVHGMSKHTVYAYLRGQSDMQGQNIKKLADILNLELISKL